MDEEELARLPGYREDAVVRHFDAPEAISTRFYEVRAKSILNRVPEASQMPFRWTINPYRGCTHSCLYCLDGETPVLMGDGRPRPLADLEVGDTIYGTRITASGERRYVLTSVLDRWKTVKPAYRLRLAGGTELIASADHRFLTNRGWKHVRNSGVGDPDRPHLTEENRLVGTGAFAPQPVQGEDYRRGYVCGMVRAGGLPAGDIDTDRGRAVVGDRFGPMPADAEALRRARASLAADVRTGGGAYALAAAEHREARASSAGAASASDRITAPTDWPVLPSLGWCRGFLAGVFDAEGSRGLGALRIAHPNPVILAWAEACLRRLGFEVALGQDRGLKCLVIRGGLAAQLRFFHLTDPAVTRNRVLVGEGVETSGDLGVAEIEPLGPALTLYDITTGTGDFIANGVVSHNCFARPTHTYLDFNAGEDFERQIIVKVNAPERLRVELARPSWKGEHVALGTNTDPYQWVEGRYRLMRGIWREMINAGNPSSVLTKSPLLLRDLDLMRELNAATDFSAALSVPTVDEKAWRATEPHTPNPRARLEAVAELTRAGIRTGVLVAPLMPGINDDPEQVQEILQMATEAGAAYVTGIALHLRGEVRGLFLDWLAEHRPDLLERYRALYRKGAYMPTQERSRLAELVKGPDLAPSQRGRAAYVRAVRPAEPGPVPAQESLFDAGMLG